jgi:hypothetical protein
VREKRREGREGERQRWGKNSRARYEKQKPGQKNRGKSQSKIKCTREDIEGGDVLSGAVVQSWSAFPEI